MGDKRDMSSIPNELSREMNTAEGRRKVIELYKDSDTSYSGVNEDGETVLVSISETGLVVKTFQSNGWCRVNYYDSNGVAEGETFEGRWDK